MRNHLSYRMNSFRFILYQVGHSVFGLYESSSFPAIPNRCSATTVRFSHLSKEFFLGIFGQQEQIVLLLLVLFIVLWFHTEKIPLWIQSTRDRGNISGVKHGPECDGTVHKSTAWILSRFVVIVQLVRCTLLFFLKHPIYPKELTVNNFLFKINYVT